MSDDGRDKPEILTSVTSAGTSSTVETVSYGTAALDAPIARADFERAIRYIHLSGIEQHDLLLRLAAQVVALTEQLDAGARTRVEAAIAPALERIRTADARSSKPSVWLDASLEDKYAIESSSPPCAELIHLCNARCCSFEFPLSTADLDEGVIRWDYGQPYRIRQRASDGFCVHHDPAAKTCTVHAQRPGACRHYDCRNDSRVWIDYDKRIPAPMGSLGTGNQTLEPFDLIDRAKRRSAAEAIELNAVVHAYPDAEPRLGPPPKKP